MTDSVLHVEGGHVFVGVEGCFRLPSSRVVGAPLLASLLVSACTLGFRSLAQAVNLEELAATRVGVVVIVVVLPVDLDHRVSHRPHGFFAYHEEPHLVESFPHTLTFLGR